MAKLSQKELAALADQLTREQTLVKKYKLYSTLCTDPQLRTKCEQQAAKHQNHYNTLLGQLN
ncbi:MAG: spore coat protein [Angelakisella sp.]|nr:spore coat protein [Angelakisella sp.]